MAERVAVFLDYENANRTGHQLYTEFAAPHHSTTIDPMRIAKLIVARRRFPSSLAAVYTFRGRPLPQFQPEACSASDLLATAWENDGVHVVRRDLKYLVESDATWSAQEKGIDVALAIAATEGALGGGFDVAVIFSNDHDQLPTLELLFHKLDPKVEIACWAGAKPLWFPAMLRETPPRRLPYCHFLGADDFLECRDLRGSR